MAPLGSSEEPEIIIKLLLLFFFAQVAVLHCSLQVVSGQLIILAHLLRVCKWRKKVVQAIRTDHFTWQVFYRPKGADFKAANGHLIGADRSELIRCEDLHDYSGANGTSRRTMTARCGSVAA